MSTCLGVKLLTYPGGLKIQSTTPKPSEDNPSLVSCFHNFSELWFSPRISRFHIYACPET